MKVKFSIIIVNFNTRELLKKCLYSVFNHLKRTEFEVIVVDNASSDGSSKMVADKFLQVKLIKNNKNVGFGSANNQAAKIAEGKYLFFLNSDAYLTDDSILKLIVELDKNPKIGVAGTLVLNPNHSIQQSAGFFPDLPQVFYWMSFLDDLPNGDLLKPYHVDHNRFYAKEQEVDWVTGASMVVRKEVFDKISGFDKKIFMYGEDVDLCFQVKNAGFKIIFSPAAKILHLGRGSVNQTNIGAIVGEYKGLIYLYDKYKNNLAKLMLIFLLKAGALARILIFGIIMMRKELLKAYLQAFKV